MSRLRALRKEADETQEQVANALGVRVGVYMRWENSSVKPNADNLIALLLHFRQVLNRPSIDVTDLVPPEEPVASDPAVGE